LILFVHYNIREGPGPAAVNKGDWNVGESMTSQSIFEVVERYGWHLGLRIAPHNLRRTFAKLAHSGHAPLK